MIKDIKLTKSKDGKYDWTFQDGDVKTVIGEQRLINATKHAILLKRYELLQDLYKHKGCDVHNFIKTSGTPNAVKLCEESIILACKEIDGVKDATTTVSLDNGIGIQELTLIKDNGEEVTVHAI